MNPFAVTMCKVWHTGTWPVSPDECLIHHHSNRWGRLLGKLRLCAAALRQDGIDTYSITEQSLNLYCFQGLNSSLAITDCIRNEEKNNHFYEGIVTWVSDAMITGNKINFSSFSVSESLEWVCTKTIFLNGSIQRGCEKAFTGTLIL